jgi:flagellin-like hook-associated protein FlgL
MVINANISGAANNGLASAVDRSNSRTRSNNSPGQSSVPGWNTLSAQVDDTLGQGGLDIADSDGASQSSKLARSGFLSQPATAMFAQANFSPDMVMSLLHE